MSNAYMTTAERRTKIEQLNSAYRKRLSDLKLSHTDSMHNLDDWYALSMARIDQMSTPPERQAPPEARRRSRIVRPGAPWRAGVLSLAVGISIGLVTAFMFLPPLPLAGIVAGAIAGLLTAGLLALLR